MPENINYLDVLLVVILTLFTLRGVFRGFLDEVAGLVAIVGGVMAAGKYAGLVSAELLPYITDASWAYIVAYVLIMCGVLLGVSMITRLIHKFLKVTYADWLNHLAGAVVGGLKGLVIAAILVGLLQLFLTDASFVRTSKMVPHVAKVTSLLRDFFPQVRRG